MLSKQLKSFLKLSRSAVSNVAVALATKSHLHTGYNPANTNVIQMKCMRTTFDNYRHEFTTERITLGDETLLEYYDSHRHDPNIKYKQSSVSTVVILPSTEHPSLESYAELIGSLAACNHRVIALNLPGVGKSKVLDPESNFAYSPIHKVFITHDFLNYYLPNRLK
jgi:hypothetical protein